MLETLAQKISSEFCKMSTSFHRTPLVAASKNFFSRNTSDGWFYSCFLQNAISELTCCFFHSVYIAAFFLNQKIAIMIIRKSLKFVSSKRFSYI